MVIPLDYIDGDYSLNNLFIMRITAGRAGVVDADNKIIIDFEWTMIKGFTKWNNSNGKYTFLWQVFMAYTEDGICHIFSDKDEHLVGDMDKGLFNYGFLSGAKLKKRSLNRKMKDRYLLIFNATKMGAIANGHLLQEPTLTWSELFQIIKEDWENNIGKECGC